MHKNSERMQTKKKTMYYRMSNSMNDVKALKEKRKKINKTLVKQEKQK